MAEEEIKIIVLDLPTSAPTNWDDAEKLLHHAFYNELRAAPEEHPILVSESSFINPASREKLTQVLFETFNVPLLSIVPTSLLAIHSHFLSPNKGLPSDVTGLSIHCGGTGTEIVPIHNGIPLRDVAIGYPVYGSLISGYLADVLVKARDDISSSAISGIMKKCYTALEPSSHHTTEVLYELPDGSQINLGDSSWLCVEPLFYPEMISIPYPPLALTILDVINQCPQSAQSTMLENIVLSGGSVSFPGFAQRLQKDLTYLLQDTDFKVSVSLPGGNGEYVPYLGGSLMATLIPDFLTNNCISMENYNEIGPAVIHSICK